MGVKICVLGLIIFFSQYLRSAMVRFPFTKLGPFSTFQLFKWSKLCYNFFSRFENENMFFDISSNPLPIAVQNSLTNQFYQKNWCFCIFSTKKKWQVFPGPFSTFQFCIFFVENLEKLQFFWYNWLVNEFWTTMGRG